MQRLQQRHRDVLRKAVKNLKQRRAALTYLVRQQLKPPSKQHYRNTVARAIRPPQNAPLDVYVAGCTCWECGKHFTYSMGEVRKSLSFCTYACLHNYYDKECCLEKFSA